MVGDVTYSIQKGIGLMHMFKALAAAMSFGLIVAACTTVSSETRLASPFKASEFNDVTSQYLERPTFLSIQSFSDGNTALKVLMDEYGTGYSATLGVVTEHATYFDQRYVPTYLPLIDKYLEWETLARERGDLIEREIGSTKTWGSAGDIDMKFSIYSASQSLHLLVVQACVLGTCTEKALHLSRPNVEKFRGVLADFGRGDIGNISDDAVYR